MKLFKCQACGQVLYFENVRCERCAHVLGYLPRKAVLSALEAAGEAWQPLGESEPRRFCANAEQNSCNWLLEPGAEGTFCLACRHNHLVPDLSIAENVQRWRKIEIAKHRLFYTLLRLGLPLQTRAEDPAHGLAFDFLAEAPAEDAPKVMTGHDNGLITLALFEADDAVREQRRTEMGETYRTLLGHFRHEVGHHFWDLLVRDGGRLDEFRALFGDERADYAEALRRHYETGAPADWQARFVSAYASSHPWEDFAESWAHYLHMVDTLETARAFGLEVDPPVTDDPSLTARVDFDPHRQADIERLVAAWLPLAFAMNSLNRAMGQPDAYPFVLSPPAIEKLGFVCRVVHGVG